MQHINSWLKSAYVHLNVAIWASFSLPIRLIQNSHRQFQPPSEYHQSLSSVYQKPFVLHHSAVKSRRAIHSLNVPEQFCRILGKL